MKTRNITCIMWTTFLSIIVVTFLGYFSNVQANGFRLAVPIYTAHTSNPRNYDLNEDVYGLMLEYENHGKVIGIGRMRNSLDRDSTVIYSGIEYGMFTASLAYATSYGSTVGKNGDLVFVGMRSNLIYPLVGIKYKWLRIVTSYPFGTLTLKEHTFSADVIQVQLVIPLK